MSQGRIAAVFHLPMMRGPRRECFDIRGCINVNLNGSGVCRGFNGLGIGDVGRIVCLIHFFAIYVYSCHLFISLGSISELACVVQLQSGFSVLSGEETQRA